MSKIHFAISTMLRKGLNGDVIGNYNYIYEPNTNKLVQVNHNSAPLVNYSYNDIGQMIEQDEAGNAFEVRYNAYGITKEVRDLDNGNLLVSYHYDDRGDLVKRTDYNAGTPVKNTFYVRDATGNPLAIYQGSTLIEVPVYGSGRVALFKPQLNTYFYELGDHLGNVRAVIGAPDTDVYTATMESENQATEQPPFKNISARRVIFVGANNTPGGNEVVRLNNTQPAGPTLALAVSPGDQVNLETWAYYEAGSNYNNSISSTTMIAAIASAFGGVLGAPGEAGQIYNSINNAFTSGGAALGGTSSTTLPGAYLAYLVMDVNKNFTGQGGFFRVTTAGNLAKEKISSPTLTMEHPGYIYVFLYNRSNSANWVYFDDLKVTHQRSPIVAGADFYPYGLAMDGREITDEPYRYGYQGQYSEKDSVTGWNVFDLRMYDARFGRWKSTDPYKQYASGYVGMGNAPHMSIDPDGGFNLGATLVGAVGGFAVGSLVGLAVDKDNWWKYGIGGAVIGGIAGAIQPDLDISQSASGWVEFRAEVEHAITGTKGSIVSGRNTYYYGPGARASWETLANISLPAVRQSMSQWCVFACSESLNRHFGGSRTQTDFSRSYNGGRVIDRGIQGDLDYGKHYVSNFKTGENGAALPSQGKITGHLKNNNPISIKVDRGTVNGQRMDHNMIIKGIQRNTKSRQYRLLIMDPAGQVNRATYQAINKVHRYYFVILGL